MKTLKFIGIAIATILFCVNFSACSKEGVPQYKLVIGEKKIAKLEINDAYDHSIWNLSYDNAGKLQEVIYKVIYNREEDTRKYDYVWNSDAIKSSYQTFSLSDGLVRNHANYHEVTYHDGRPHEIKCLSPYGVDYYGVDYTFSWNSNGGLYSRGTYNIIRNGESSQGYITELFSFIYDSDMTTIKTKGFNPVAPYFLSYGFDGDPLCFAHPELVGGRTDILPTHFSKTAYWFDQNNRFISKTIHGTCSYKFDNDGYVTECYMCEDNSDEYSYQTKYTITWE